MAEATGNPGMPTPHDQGRADAKKGRPYDNPYDQPGEQQEHSQYKKGYEQGKQQGVAEAYQFKGDFPFDVDHMNGAVYRGGDTPAGLSKNTKMQYHDKQQWQAAVNKTNSLRYDDNSEFNSDRSGTTVEVDGKIWAVWNDVKGFGWVEAGTGVEEGLGKTIKRGLQGWGRSGMTGPNGEDFNDPRDIVRRNRGYDDKTVQGLQKSMSGPGPGFPFNHGDIDKHPHSPAGLQKRVLDREMKKRGLGEEGVPHNDPNLAKAYRMGNEAYLAFKNDPARAQAAQDKIESEFPQYAAMWLTGYRDGERFDKEKSVSESVDPVEQLRADIKRFAQ